MFSTIDNTFVFNGNFYGLVVFLYGNGNIDKSIITENFAEFIHFSKCFNFTKKLFKDYLFIVEVQALFKAIDSDLSGRVSKTELEEALKIVKANKSFNEIKEIFEKLEDYANNINVTEAITLNDFLDKLVRRDELKEFKKLFYSELFDKFDTDHSGTLDENEISYMLHEIFNGGVYPAKVSSLILQILDEQNKGDVKLKQIIPFFDAIDQFIDSKNVKNSGCLTLK